MGLGHNLKFLCSFHPSIASVCRDLSINRQQFNRYLRGDNYPRGYNLKRICDYFNVTESQLNLPRKEFETNYSFDNKTSSNEFSLVESALTTLNEKSASNLNKYLGYYYEYYYSMSSPEHILKGLVCIKSVGNSVYYERFERLADKEERGQISYCYYKGLALFLNERIFMVDYESLTNNEVVEIVLYPSFKQKVSTLEGSIIGVAANSSRKPLTRDIVLEYIGSDVSLKSSLKSCFLYDPDSDLIPKNIKRKLTPPAV
ncbi:transcriptional regulator [Vibrio sp. MACH09]|uniref:helix-turn-helix domain-containing protein n=1 Tax=Vibrio sp. MACH09 TaxID=3025122 RepID=UPI00278DE6C0|nr:helix-turn-helix transcriptional regulator [Vibrio sp. MACH09]GLO60617.1 transcriptional regulator [Vibrio sp. MACH09]